MSHQKTEGYYRALAEGEAAAERRHVERLEHAKRVLMYQEDTRWLGTHVRTEPDANGWMEFAVYSRPKGSPKASARGFWWSAVSRRGELKGFEHGPFDTAREAHDDAQR